jgi:outer membrane immunogenic protein
MRNTLSVAVFAASMALGGSAMAADVYTAPSYKDVYVAPGWAGFYIGANLGGYVDDNNIKSTFSEDITYKYSKEDPVKPAKGYALYSGNNNDTPIGGVHIGYNFQSGNFVYGIEGDADFAENIDYLATIRGRLGYAFDSWLLYVTGGGAFISYNNVYDVRQAKGQSWTFSDSHQDTGYVIGGGIEKKITPNISIGVEALYYDFGSDKASHFLQEKSSYCETKDYYASVSNDENFYVVRARLTYHFPVAAVYEPLK